MAHCLQFAKKLLQFAKKILLALLALQRLKKQVRAMFFTVREEVLSPPPARRPV
jgi:hypothetical protein